MSIAPVGCSVTPQTCPKHGYNMAITWLQHGWLASQQKVPPSPGLIIISIIIIVMIVKLLIISSISTISFIHICNMNDINNNIVRIYHNGGAIMVSA